jgi:glycine oxidase
MKRIAIIGAGVLGRLTAFELSDLGAEVTLFEKDQADGINGTTAVAAGMIAPYCELETADLQIHRLGLTSLELWRKRLAKFNEPVYFQNAGSLVVAHSTDRSELERLRRFVARAPGEPGYHALQGLELSRLEPELDPRFTNGLYFPHEGQIDTRAFLTVSAREFARHGIRFIFSSEVDDPRTKCRDFDRVIDCRGIEARSTLANLRGVRGEVIRVHAPDVVLNRPLRLMHPRYPIYVVPRPDHHFVIGATQIESDDTSPVSVRSALELLSAVYALHSGFSEARILEMRSGLRPAFPDHLPRITVHTELIQANGLYRYGFLIAPKIASLIAELAMDRTPDPTCREIYAKFN